MKNKKRLLTLALLCMALAFSVLGLSACGNAVEFKINFMVDGEVVSTINTGGNETIALPDDPVKEGFTFDGWYWDNDTWQRPFTASSLLNEPLSKDMNVYAKWQGDGISFKTLVADDKDNVYGKVSNTQQTFSFLNEVSVTGKATFVVSNDIYGVNQIPTKTVPLNVGDNTYYVLESIGSNIRLFTVTIRRKPMYTVSFDTSGGSNVLSQQIEEDAFATEPDAATRQGYTFNGWNYDFTKAVTENISITAGWNIINYDIVYVLNGGENSANNPLRYTVEQTITLSAPSKTGYAFAGWSDGGEILLGSTGTKTFIANWQPVVYTLTYVCGDGENNSLNVTNYTIESETIVLSDPYDINADFTEWQCNGKKITEIPKGSYGDLTLTAVWEKYDVKLKLNTDGKTYSVIGINTDKADIVIKPIYKTYSVTAIAENAFKNCSSLTGITIPDSVTSIGNFAFSNCNSLNAVYITDIAAWCNIKFNDYTSNPLYYAHNLYLNGKLVTDLVIPDSVTSIGNSAFSWCTSLTSVTIPDSVISIGYKAFDNCPIEYASAPAFAFGYIGKNNLKTAIITSGNSICDEAFKNCTSLISVAIPDSVTSIDSSAFENCIAVYTENEIQYFDTWVVGVANTSLTKAVIKDGTKGIAGYAFSNCTSLTSVTIPDSVTSIGSRAFNDCDSLKVVYITDIAAWCNIKFSYSNPLGYAHNLYLNGELVTDLVIPDSVTSISDYAFYRCTSLTSVTIGNGVTWIGKEAFQGCKSLTSITIPDSVTSIGGYAFCNCDRLKTINYTGSEEQWKSIRKGDAWAPSTGININYNYVIPTNESTKEN